MGLVCVITKRNVVHILMGIELILNAASLNMITFSHFIKPYGATVRMTGQVFSIFIIVLAILFCVFSAYRTPKVDEMTELKG